MYLISSQKLISIINYLLFIQQMLNRNLLNATQKPPQCMTYLKEALIKLTINHRFFWLFFQTNTINTVKFFQAICRLSLQKLMHLQQILSTIIIQVESPKNNNFSEFTSFYSTCITDIKQIFKALLNKRKENDFQTKQIIEQFIENINAQNLQVNILQTQNDKLSYDKISSLIQKIWQQCITFFGKQKIKTAIETMRVRKQIEKREKQQFISYLMDIQMHILSILFPYFSNKFFIFNKIFTFINQKNNRIMRNKKDYQTHFSNILELFNNNQKKYEQKIKKFHQKVYYQFLDLIFCKKHIFGRKMEKYLQKIFEIYQEEANQINIQIKLKELQENYQFQQIQIIFQQNRKYSQIEFLKNILNTRQCNTVSQKITQQQRKSLQQQGFLFRDRSQT